MITKLFDELIVTYVQGRDRLEKSLDEMPLFITFYLQFLEGIREDKAKYNQFRTIGLAFIRQHKKELYKRIREAFRQFHPRGKNNRSFRAGKAYGMGRRRARRLV